MRIRDFTHKGLKRLYTEASARGVVGEHLPQFVHGIWKAHILTGDRKGTWSLSVTRNRRLTFRIDTVEHEVCDVNLEDYH